MAAQVEGMRVYTGGEELRRAAAALSGPSLAPRPSVSLALPAQQAGHTCRRQRHFMLCLTMRDNTSLFCFQAGHVDRTGHTSKTSSFNDRRQSQDQPEAFQKIDSQSTNFEPVYNDGLILQEKASQAGGSAQGQLDLLKQVRQLLNQPCGAGST